MVGFTCGYDTYALDWPRTTHSQFTCGAGRLAISKCVMSIVITSTNGKLDVLDVYRANACIPFVSLGIVSIPRTFSPLLRRDDAPPKAPGAG